MDKDDPGSKAKSAQLPAITRPAAPGSLPLRHRVHERYCRYRAEGLPRDLAYQKASLKAYKTGRHKIKPKTARDMSSILEQRPQIAQRIQYIRNDTLELTNAKRQRLEEALWSIHESDIGELFEQYDKTEKIGDTVTSYKANRPKLLEDIPPEIRRNIEKINIDGRGRIVPQMYSKLAASQELRKMLEIGKLDERSDIQRLSDADLIAQLADQANQLGIKVDLNYSFAQRSESDPAPEEPPDGYPIEGSMRGER